jgi:hypothetical protein
MHITTQQNSKNMIETISTHDGNINTKKNKGKGEHLKTMQHNKTHKNT